MSAGLPAGFREGHAGDLACRHRDLTTCSACQAEHPEIWIFAGRAFWISNPDSKCWRDRRRAEQAESLALEKARIEKNYSEKQISFFK